MNAAERDAVRTAIEHLNNYDATTRAYEIRSALAALNSAYAGSGSYAGSYPAAKSEGDSLSKLLADMNPTNFVASRYAIEPLHARLRAMMENDGVESEGVDVVNGEDAQSLPVDSIVIRSDRDGTPLTEVYSPKVITKYDSPVAKTPTAFYRVLYRAPVPPLAVGDEVTGDRLASADVPDGTVVIAASRNNGPMFLPLIKTRRGWEGGSAGPIDRLTGPSKYQVLRIGGES